MATPAFQKGDHVAFKEFPEGVEGRIVGVWKGNAYKVAWDSGLAYRGRTMIVSGNAIRKTAQSSQPLACPLHQPGEDPK